MGPGTGRPHTSRMRYVHARYCRRHARAPGPEVVVPLHRCSAAYSSGGQDETSNVAGAAAKDPRPSRGQRKDMSSTGSATSTKTIRYVCVTTKQYKSQSALKSELKQIIQINACSKPGAWGMKLLSKMGIYIPKAEEK